jgi:hypothetical protein
MGALPGLVAHGGVGGAVIEALVGLAILGVFVAVWLRERRVREDAGEGGDGPARLRDADEAPPEA